MASRSARKRPLAGRVAAFDGKPRRILGYARVSSVGQARGSSLDSQQASMSAHAARAYGMEVTRFYVEAESSRREKLEFRVQMQALMADVREGDLILCDKLDRWSRDPEFSYQSIRQIVEAGARFYSVSDQCDPSTPEGDTLLNFRIAFAREEAKRIRERTVGERQGLRDQGFYSEGPPPYGYRRGLPKGEREPEKKNTLVVEAVEAETVREVFRRCAGGRSIDRIAADLGLTRDLVAGILRRRFYIGEIENTDGVWIRGKHPAIVDVDLFTRARAALDERRLGGARPRDAATTTSTWVLRDVARCAGCGARMASAFAGPIEGGGYARHYYRCSHRCTRAHVSVTKVEAAADPLVLARLEELRGELAKPPKPPTTTIDVEAIAAKRAALAKRRERASDSYIDGALTRDQLRAKLADLDAEGLRLDALEGSIAKANPLAETSVRRAVLKQISAVRLAWTKGKPETKRAIVNQLAVEVRMGGPVPVFVWRSAEDLASAI